MNFLGFSFIEPTLLSNEQVLDSSSGRFAMESALLYSSVQMVFFGDVSCIVLLGLLCRFSKTGIVKGGGSGGGGGAILVGCIELSSFAGA